MEKLIVNKQDGITFVHENWRGMIRFIAHSDIPLTENKAWALQKNRSNYHPSGYGFYDFKCEEIEAGKFISSWNSLSSAD